MTYRFRIQHVPIEVVVRGDRDTLSDPLDIVPGDIRKVDLVESLGTVVGKGGQAFVRCIILEEE